MAEAHDRDPDDVVTVTEDGITVEKRFTTDEFPVPAVKFDIRSEADDPVDVRLTDDIPDSFDMDRVGFHPEYEGEAWTAYRDHRVEYERTVDPDEEVTTVYGVRIDDPSTGGRFLGEPRIERVSGGTPAADPEEILGRETTGAVRDALAGEGELAADAEADGAVDLDAPADVGAAESAGPAVDLDDPVGAGADADGDLDLDGEGGEAGDLEIDVDESEPPADDLDLDVGESEPSAEGDEGAEAGSEAAAGDIDLEGLDADDDAESDAEPTTDVGGAAPDPRSLDQDLTPAVERGAGDGTGGNVADETEAAAAGGGAGGALPGNVVAAVASEVRDGTADEEDIAVLREALEIDRDPEIPRSLEVRIDRLQNRTEDLAAYTDALEAFLDEEGTGQEVLDDLDERTAALREDLDAVEAETTDVGETVAEHDDRLGDLEETVDDLDEHVASLDDGLDDLGDRVDDLETDLDDLAGDAESSVADLREAIEDLEATAADFEDEIEDLQSFRDRMRDAFGS